MRLPDFFIVGAPKAGTTSAYHYLAQHPEVFLSSVKEPNHFASHSIMGQGLYYDVDIVADAADYAALFSAADGYGAVGEASVSYLFYPEACERIHAAIPEARILVFLRDPAERAFSHYLMDQRLGLVHQPLAEIVSAGALAGGGLHYQQYVSLGLYHAQLQRYLEAFGEDRVLVTFFEDLKQDPVAASKRIFRFLGVSEAFEPETRRVHNPYRKPRGGVVGRLYQSRGLRSLVKRAIPGGALDKARALAMPAAGRPVLDAGLRGRLIELFAGDIDRLQRLCGRDLEAWRRA
jgi:hypothetical protein